jgi:hypothetical protein
MRTLWLAAALAGVVLSGCAAKVPVISDAGASTIIRPDKVDGKVAAVLEEFRGYVRKSTGVDLSVLPESRAAEVKGTRFYIERGEFVNARIGAQLDGLSLEGALLQAEGDTVILAGRTPRATAAGLREFLRRYCGVEWYMPGPLWEVARRQNGLSVPAGVTVIEPTFKSRQLSGLNNRANTAANWQWSDRQNVGARYSFHHSAFALFPAEKFGKDHPEVYSLVGGKRMVPGPKSVEGWQICMTHPLVFETYAKSALAAPPGGGISVAPNDGGMYCECAECARFYSPDATEKNRCTRLVFNLVNEVARRVAKERPDVLIGIMSYSNYSDVVPGLRVEPNVVLFQVGCRSGYGNAETRRMYEDRLLAWKEAGVKRFGIYEWYHGSTHNVPPLYMGVMAEALRFAAKNGADGLYAEMYPNWGMQGPANYVLMRLAWDVDQDTEALVGRFCEDLFGPAAGPMREYFRLCEERWGRSGASRWASPDQYTAYPAEVRRELRALLDRAAALAGADAVLRERVEFFSKSFGFSERMAAAYDAGTAAEAAIQKGDIAAALAALAPLGRPEDDPILFMRTQLDAVPLACWHKSDYLDQYVLSGIKPALRAKIAVAAPISRAAGQAVMERGGVTPGAFEDALRDAFAAYLPKDAGPDAAQAVAAVKEYAGKACFAPEATEAPVIDGDLGDAAWARAPECSGFYAYGGGVPSLYKTAFRMVWKGDRLYCAVECFQEMKGPKAGGSVRDSNVWLDDAIEIFLNRPDAAEAKDYAQVIVSVKGVIFDQWRSDPKWNGEIAVATKTWPDRWTLEASIPLKEIGMDPAQTRALRLNVVRDIFGQGNLSQINPWFPTVFGHGDLNLRGWVFLMK